MLNDGKKEVGLVLTALVRLSNPELCEVNERWLLPQVLQMEEKAWCCNRRGDGKKNGKVGVVLVFQKVAGVLCCLDDEPLLVVG